MPPQEQLWFTLQGETPAETKEDILTISFSDDGREMLTGGMPVIFDSGVMLILLTGVTGKLRIWDIASGCLQQSLHIGASITGMSWELSNSRREMLWVGSRKFSCTIAQRFHALAIYRPQNFSPAFAEFYLRPWPRHTNPRPPDIQSGPEIAYTSQSTEPTMQFAVKRMAYLSAASLAVPNTVLSNSSPDSTLLPHHFPPSSLCIASMS